MRKKWIIAGTASAVLLAFVGGGYLLTRSPGEQLDQLDEVAADSGDVVTVEHGEISSDVVLDAVIRAEPGEEIKARNGGRVTRVWVRDDERVESGAPVVDVAVPDGATGDEDDGGDGQPTTQVTLRAPDTGRISGLDLEVDDDLEPGAVVATIASDQYRAVADIPADDIYRFYDDPEDITLQIDRGPPPEECEFLSLGEPNEAGGADPEEEAVASGDGSGVELACRVPSDMDVFAGVQAKLSVVTGDATNALIVPLTAVRGTFESGEVILVGPDGEEETREVELGISDGTNVEVTAGLSVGDEVVNPVPLDERFDVPGADDDEDDDFYEGDF